jgi:hypothetical protein
MHSRCYPHQAKTHTHSPFAPLAARTRRRCGDVGLLRCDKEKKGGGRAGRGNVT